MKLYSYVVARDYGFAPNPFYAACTLATCKPRIRKTAKPNDWVLGTGCAERKRSGTLVYAMSPRITVSMFSSTSVACQTSSAARCMVPHLRDEGAGESAALSEKPAIQTHLPGSCVIR